jgi:hypothetical protein
MKPFTPNENLQSPWLRMRVGAAYGFFGGIVYALVHGTVDVLTYPDLPMHILWPETLLLAVLLGAGLALGGAAAGQGEESVQGILTSAAVLSLIALVVSISQSTLIMSMRLIAFTVLILPIAAVCFPVAWLLHWLGVRQSALNAKEGWVRLRGTALLILCVFTLSAAPALFSRMPRAAARAVTFVHERFQAASAGDTEALAQIPLQNIPDLPAHLAQPYELSYIKSKTSSVGYDVTLWFADGYIATCTLTVYGEQKPFLRACAEGPVLTAP